MRIFLIFLSFLVLLAESAAANELTGRWRLTFEIEGSGTLDSVVEFNTSRKIRGRSVSVAAKAFRDIFPGSAPTHFVTMRLQPVAPGKFNGRIETIFGDSELNVTVGDGGLTGNFDGEITGKLTGVPFTGDLPLRDYQNLLATIDAQTQGWLYDRRLTQTDEWKLFRDSLGEATAIAEDDFDMIEGFRRAWGEGLFSHYELMRPLKTMEQLVQQADEIAEDKPVARVEFTPDNIAVVTIDSFFGAQIEAQIDAVFNEVIDRSPIALVIDVRENGGGTLAAWPVGARILQEEAIGGYFISNRWWAEHDALPTTHFLEASPSPEEISPQAFQQDLFSDGVLVMRIAPAEKTYDGPVYVLISKKSRSATEAVIGMLQYVGRVTVVGENSAGYMLNSNFFPLAEDFTLRIPVADFFLPNHKSLEAVGVAPDIATAPADAFDAALERIRGD